MDGIISIIDERVLLVVILVSMLIMTQGTMKKMPTAELPDSVNFDEIPLEIEDTTAALEEETNSEEPS